MVKIIEVKELAKIKVGEVVEYNGDKIKVAGPEENKKKKSCCYFCAFDTKDGCSAPCYPNERDDKTNVYFPIVAKM